MVPPFAISDWRAGGLSVPQAASLEMCMKQHFDTWAFDTLIFQLLRIRPSEEITKTLLWNPPGEEFAFRSASKIFLDKLFRNTLPPDFTVHSRRVSRELRPEEVFGFTFSLNG